MDESDRSLPELQPSEINLFPIGVSGGVLVREIREKDEEISRLKTKVSNLEYRLEQEPDYIYRDTCERCWQVKSLLRLLAE